ncbi:MAG: carboxypeptidase regulatory-like domain-containing protein [Pseudomonadota bacterium]
MDVVRHCAAWFRRAVLTFVVLLPQAVPADGLSWLTGQAQPDGSFFSPSDIAVPFQSTAETLRTFRALGESGQPGYAAAQQFLIDNRLPIAGFLARHALAVAGAGGESAALVTDLLAFQNADGGFGGQPGHASAVLDTALALEALDAVGQHATSAESALNFLVNRQNLDGGWGQDLNDESSVYVTALSLKALSGFQDRYVIGASLSGAQEFLLAQRGADALWGEDFLSATALIALVASLNDLTPVADSLAALREAQLADGSWSADVFTTALMLRTLGLADAPPGDLGLATILGQVVEGQTGLPLEGVSVTIKGPNTRSLQTDADGLFQFQDLVAGTYSIEAVATGYATLSGTTVAVPGQSIDFGVLRLLPSLTSTTGTIHGVITNAETGEPLDGVSVTLSGAETAAATTGAEGAFQFTSVSTGSLTITATKTGFSSARAQGNLPAGGVFVFSAGLTPVTAPQTALRGVVVDANTGEALEGVTMTVSGAADATAQTGATGDYEIADLVPGDITVTAVLAGYDIATATATLYENMVLHFSPSLYPSGTRPPGVDDAGVSGTVVDAGTNRPLAGVAIQATFGTETYSLFTDGDGRFLIDGLQELDGSMTLNHDGYVTNAFYVTLEPFRILDIGEILLLGEEVAALLPDLRVQRIDAADVVTNTDTLVAGGSLRVEVANQGSAEAPAGAGALVFYDADQDGAYDPRADTFLGGGDTTMPLAAGASEVVAIGINGSLPYRDAPVSVWIDSDQAVIETIEQNNIARSDAHCAIAEDAPGADLTASLLRVTEQTLGGLRLSLRVGNAGGQATAFGGQVRFFEGDPAAGGAVIGELDVPALDADSYRDVFLPDLEGLTGGMPLFARVDPDDQIAECREDNNTAEIPAPDLKPDLMVESLSRTGLVTDLATGNIRGSLRATVANQGTAETRSGFEVAAFYDDDGNGVLDGDEPLLGTAAVTEPVAIGASIDLSIPVNGILPFRDAPISLWADSGDAVVEEDESNNVAGSETLQCRVPLSSRLYTQNADFELGTSINVVTKVPDQLQLDDTAREFPFIWVPASGRGTIVKIDTRTGGILGEYLSSPSGRARNPSRTTVDLSGNVWTGNRDESSGGRGSVVQVGLAENGQCEDRNGNGVIDTSTGLGDIRPWSNTGGVDNNGGVSSSADECIIKYVRVAGDKIRHVSVDANNNVWVAGNFGSDNAFDLIEGATGNIISSFDVGCGGYGGLVDGNGVIWSANRGPRRFRFLRYDTRNTLTRSDDTYTCPYIYNTYGVGIDSQGNIWNSLFTSNAILKIDPSGTVLGRWNTGGASGDRGVAVTPDDHVWVANSLGSNVSRLTNEGQLVAVIPVGTHPTGVSVDAAGKVWVANRDSDSVSQIDPATNTVDLTVSLGFGARPYNYGDMTGSVLQGAPAEGTWSVVYDSGAAGTPWGTLNWSASIPDDGQLVVTAESSDDGLSFSAATVAVPEADLDVPDGRYLRVSVRFVRASTGASPVLYDLEVASAREAVADLTASQVRVVDEGFGLPLQLMARVGNAGASIAPAAALAFYEGDPAKDGRPVGTAILDGLGTRTYADVVMDAPADLAGNRDIHVFVDPDDSILECDELNNRDQTPVPASTLGRIATATDAPIYGPDSPVDLRALATNTGAVAGEFSAWLQVEDSMGVVVQRFATRALGTLEGGHAVVLGEHWNTGSYLAGDYLLRGVLQTAGGELIDESTTPFRIQHGHDGEPVVSLRTTTDRLVYNTTDSVEINDLIQNLTPNALVEHAVLNLVVTDPLGGQALSETIDLGQLVPGSLRHLVSPLGLLDAPLGPYAVLGEVLDVETGEVLASDTGTFDVVQDLAAVLAGDVEAQFPTLYVGETQVCTDRLTNNGSIDIQDLPVRQLVVRVDVEAELGMQQSNIVLPVGITQSMVRSVQTDGFEPGHYACVLQAYIDNDRKWQPLADAVFEVVEPPIRIDTQVTTGPRGRLLVLIDEDGQAPHWDESCSSVGAVTLRKEFDSLASADAQFEGAVSTPNVALADHEIATLSAAGLPVNASAGSEGVDLSIVQFDDLAAEIRVSIDGTTSGQGPGDLGISGTLTAGGVASSYQSAAIDASCATPIAPGDPSGDFLVVDLMLRFNGPLGPGQEPQLSIQRSYLEALLDAAGWSYTIATTAGDFARELHSGGYENYLLLSEMVKLEETVQKELREAVYRGAGIVVAGMHDNRGGRILDALGVSLNGRESAAAGVELLESADHGAVRVSLALLEKAERVILEGAEVLGYYFDADGNLTTEPAVTRHGFGAGRSVFIGHDLLAEATQAGDQQNIFAAMLLKALAHVDPDSLAVLAGGTVPLRAVLSNLGRAVSGKVSVTPPVGAEVIDAGTGTVSGGMIEYPFVLAVDATETLDFWVRLPPDPVTRTFIFRVLVEDDSEIGFHEFDVVDWVAAPVIRNGIDAALTLLEADNTYKDVTGFLHKARDALAVSDYTKAISYLVTASDRLATYDTPEAATARGHVANELWRAGVSLWRAELAAGGESSQS